MNEGEPIKWRVHFNQLISRPIPETEFPTIAQRMFDDGLIAVLSLDGLKWFSGRYQVTAKVVRDMWSLSEHQFKRFNRWVYKNDAFMLIYQGDDEQ
tara:strand:+ start:53 stop:340 length:288 start_codon:yes stop_codon:yes gene_type:complete